MRALPDRPTTMTVPVLAAAARLAGALSAHRRGDRHAGCDGRSREQSRNSRARTLPLHSAWIYGQSWQHAGGVEQRGGREVGSTARAGQDESDGQRRARATRQPHARAARQGQCVACMIDSATASRWEPVCTPRPRLRAAWGFARFAVCAASRRHARATLALSCSMRRCSDSCTRCAPLCARSLARSPPCVPSVHSLLSVSPRPRKGLLTLPAMPLQPYQAINSTGGGAEHEDPCEGAERTMLTMRCRRGARSRGSMRVPDRSVMTGVESALASVTPRTWACSSASAGLPPSPWRRWGEEG